MPYTRRTGGVKEFHYTKEVLERIESDDTKYTRDFKDALRHHRSRKGMRAYYKDKKIPIPEHHKRYMERDKYKKPKTSKPIVIIIIVLGLIYLIFGEIPDKIEVEKTKIVKVNQSIPSIISFSKYIEDPYKYDSKKVELKGYLMRFIEGKRNTGVFVEAIKDDKGNKIDFLITPREYIKLFPRVGETDNLYEVRGVFKRKYKTIYLEVNEIKETERDSAGAKEIDKTITYKEFVKSENKTKVYNFVENYILNSLKEMELKGKTEEIKIDTEGIIKKISTTSSEVLEGVSKKLEELDSPAINETEIENQIFRLTNTERISKGRHTLVRNSYLDSLAKSHSEKMLKNNFFEHSNLNLGENIMYTPIHYDVIGCGSTLTSNQQAKCMVEGWIDSPGHHANMIDYSYVSTGIGVACDLTKCKSTHNFR